MVESSWKWDRLNGWYRTEWVITKEFGSDWMNILSYFLQNYSSSEKREAKLARILVMIVFFFLFCNLGKLALNIFDLGNLGKLKECEDAGLVFKSPSWVVAMISFNHLLLVMNASANLVLICATGTQFRATLLAMLRLKNRLPNSLNHQHTMTGDTALEKSGRSLK